MVQRAEATIERLRETIVFATIAFLWIGTPLMTIYAIVNFVTRVWAH